MSNNRGKGRDSAIDMPFEKPVLTRDHSGSLSHLEGHLTPNQRVADELIKIDHNTLSFLMPGHKKDSRGVSLVNFSLNEIIEMGKYINEKMKESPIEIESLLRDRELPHHNKLDRAFSTLKSSIEHATSSSKAEHFDINKKEYEKIMDELSEKPHNEDSDNADILRTCLSIYHIDEYEKKESKRELGSMRYLESGNIDNINKKSYTEWNKKISTIMKDLNSNNPLSHTESKKTKIRKDSY